MAKIVALDVGAKRTGVAESDPMHMMAFPLDTVETESLLMFLQRRQEVEPIEDLVVGAPIRWDGTPSEVAQFIDGLCQKIGEKWPELNIIRVDERFTSSLAADALERSLFGRDYFCGEVCCGTSQKARCLSCDYCS